jgi:hypothetical protein
MPPSRLSFEGPCQIDLDSLPSRKQSREHACHQDKQERKSNHSMIQDWLDKKLNSKWFLKTHQELGGPSRDEKAG